MWIVANRIWSEWIYPAATPMAGGLTVITMNTLANAYVTRTQSDEITHLKTKWYGLLSQPKVKFYVSRLIALQFVQNETDISSENIRETLKRELIQRNPNNSFSDFQL